MSNLTNSEVVECVLRALIDKIGRRTSTGFAVITIDTLLKEFKPKYDFLKYIEVQDTSYSEGMNAVNILPDIDSVETDVFYKSLNDIIKSAVRHLERKADYFFIREFKEVIDSIPDLKIEQEGINLGHMQLQYFVDRKGLLKIKNSEVTENVIRALTNLLNKILPEKRAVEIMIAAVRKLEEKYDFLKYIKISDTSDSDGFYTIRVLPDINNVSSAEMAEAIEKLIENVGVSIDWKDEEVSFIESFKNELLEEQLEKIGKKGVDLSRIQMILSRKEYEEVARKALEALVMVVGRKTSEGFAIITVNKAIKKLRETYDILKYIKIDESRYTQGANAITITSEVNDAEPYELAKALREIIRTTGMFLDEKNTASYIEDFKEQLGKEYLNEFERIGVNLYFLELKFR